MTHNTHSPIAGSPPSPGSTVKFLVEVEGENLDASEVGDEIAAALESLVMGDGGAAISSITTTLMPGES